MLFGPQIVLLLIGCVVLGVGAAALFTVFANKRNPNSRKNLLVAGLRANAQQFEGMYEPVYSVSVGKHQMQQVVFAAWNERVNECEDDTGFKAVFADAFGSYYSWGRKKDKIKTKKANKKFGRKAKKLVKLFFKAGIIRESEVFIVGDDKNAECYDIAGGGGVQPGITYEVLAPYWHLGETVLDKGAAR